MSQYPISSKCRLHNNISETALFSICGLSSVALNQSFYEDFNKEFKSNTLCTILSHFNVNEKVRNTCLAMLDSDGSELMEPYVFILTNEKFENIYSLDILHALLLLFICQGTYSSRIRYFLRHISYGLHLNVGYLQALEQELVSLISNNKQNEENTETKERNHLRKIRQGLLIGAAVVGGGVLIGVTGGLAAPFIATGIGAIGASIAGGVGAFVTGASAAIGSTAGVAVVGSLFGGAGAGLTGFKMKRRVGGLKEFSIEPFLDRKHLTLAIAITGYINKDTSDYCTPWKTLDISPEQYYLVWESKYLSEMGKSLDYLVGYVKSAALTETLKLTFLGALLSAVVWPSALLTMSSVIDNPWSVCISRAELAGRTLANTLLSADYGRRPVTLIGFSLGARVVYYCLQELASRRSTAVEDIIEDVYLIGAPVSACAESWKRFERIVACKVVNAYCSSDWVLKFLFRTATVTKSIAGLEPVQWINKRMCNMDLSSVVSGHGDYIHKMADILQLLGIDTDHFVPSLPEHYITNNSSDLVEIVSRDSDSGNGTSDTASVTDK